MAFNTANLSHIATANGFNLFRYDTTDTVATVIIDGYMNNSDDVQNIQLGDIIEVVVWGTAVRTGSVVDVGRVIVVAVDSDGTIDLSGDLLSATVTYT